MRSVCVSGLVVTLLIGCTSGVGVVGSAKRLPKEQLVVIQYEGGARVKLVDDEAVVVAGPSGSSEPWQDATSVAITPGIHRVTIGYYEIVGNTIREGHNFFSFYCDFPAGSEFQIRTLHGKTPYGTGAWFPYLQRNRPGAKPIWPER